MDTKKSSKQQKTLKTYRTVIVGAGPAGIGMGVALKDFGVYDFVILEKGLIGSTFLKWTTETRFLTPSFQSTQFGLLDLNAVAINTSPAYSSGKEHLSGPEYVHYLNRVVYEFQLPVHEEREVMTVVKRDRDFVLETVDAYYVAEYLIWSTGEFQFPNDRPFPGAELCIHNSRIGSYRDLLGDDFTIIGGYESGVDAALNLAMLGRETAILERGTVMDSKSQDPSVTLSFYTKQRLDETTAADGIRLEERTEVKKVTHGGNGAFRIHTGSGYYESPTPPILATGFKGGEEQIHDLFYNTGGRPQLNEWDESTRTPNLYLAGPHVMHQNVIFCFIYKFRQRFGIVAHRIATQLGMDTDAAVKLYRRHNMFLDDLSCCQEDCKC
ncbi:NAD(P)/FAD-dependent oxidoreductase [Parapedobacter koreensis]|uniref:Pyridine nucleotide-disulphide oxidoreductase n=1 Tax=Parapedobacter koreensis TaxID=332977 RepID=A0A1H7ICG3_9SPHI|nr:NAD(P)/FAD-dependent oxidoreductase [Parapedobacter koreensis]SEK60186.1 Pyridine nucleotide-disulphide oxidoreductase [Parapedobacter koreensis]